MTDEARPPIRVVAGVPSGPSSPAAHRVRTRRDVLSPMRDGVQLAMDLLLPEKPGAYPVILSRTPYDKVGQLVGRGRPFLEKLVMRGYVVAIQDCRGRFNSDGVFDPYRQEHEDGFDTVEWIAAQDWCDGNVGMIGGSYVGQTQWYAAALAPPALKAIVPTVSPPGHAWLNEPLYGGAWILCMTEWMHAMGRRSAQLPGLQGLFGSEPAYFWALPMSKLPEAGGVESPWFAEMLEHPVFDDFWVSVGYEQYWSQMTVPALNVTGWWDMNFIGAPRNFVGMGEHAATAEAREGQRLVIGPWEHWTNISRTLSGVDFGPGAITDMDGYTLRFFDRWLKGERTAEFDADARVHVFVVGADEWWESDAWPLPGTRPTELYLGSDGGANTHRGDGRLTWDAPGTEPPGSEIYDEYVSDPLDPVHAIWDLHSGPVDDRDQSARPDVLSYTSEVLTDPVDVVGHVTAVLYASSSARDCDWHLRLVDVQPDGEARFLCHGVLRARFREGFDHAAFLEPDVVERFEIDLTATGVRFLPGHRIRLEVASSWFSRFDRNPQTDAENWMTDERPPVTATQRVYHDADHPSHVLLPLIPARPPVG
jgi:putative CocE/NonD family hydrolase